MNDAVRIRTDGLLTTADIAARSDFTLGLAVFSPSSRTIVGPGGATVIEPRVMQVLVALTEARGEVVTRETLFKRCWGSVFVGDDSLNRAVAAIRKLAAEIADGSFEIETVPRTGYRLTPAAAEPVAERAGDSVAPPGALSRRGFAGAALGLAAIAGGSMWWSTRSRDDSRFNALVDQAYDQMVKRTADANSATLLERAIAIAPDSAKAWGLLALLSSYLAVGAGPMDSPRLVDRSAEAARRALSLDPKQPDALLAMFELEGSTLDWTARDRNLRRIVAIDPRHVFALAELADLTAATGLTRESWSWNERCIALRPLSSDFLGKRALKLWVFGRAAESDKVSDQLRALYPGDSWTWFVRVQIYAFTGRAGAALAMLDGAGAIPAMAALLRAALPALDNPSPGKIARARDSCIRAARASGMAANEAMLILSALHQLDLAFDIAAGTLLARGPLAPPEQARTASGGTNAFWRINTQWMWAPPVASMRADPRFPPLCDSVGLTQYWNNRGVKPDYMRAPRRALNTGRTAAK